MHAASRRERLRLLRCTPHAHLSARPALRRDLTAAGNCALTGMIVITSGCATLEPWAAALGGVVGGLIVLPSSLFVSHVLKIDDPVDAFVVRRFPIAGASQCCLLLLIGLHDVPLLSRSPLTQT